MTSETLSFTPAPRLTVIAPSTSAPAMDPAPQPVGEMVLVPRHVAEAAHALLQAAHALKGDGGHQLFAALTKVLDKGLDRRQVVQANACDCCHVEVGLGKPHHAECWSEEALRYRAVPIPAVDLGS